MTLPENDNNMTNPEIPSDPPPPSTPSKPALPSLDLLNSAGPSMIPFPPLLHVGSSPDSEKEIETSLRLSGLENKERTVPLTPTPPPELPGALPGTFIRLPPPKRVCKLKYSATDYKQLNSGDRQTPKDPNRRGCISNLEAQLNFLPSSQRTITGEPLHYYAAVSGKDADQWMHAMKEEIDSLTKLDVFELVNKPKDVNIVDCRWVYKIKHDPYGNIERFCACLVAKGFTQVYGVDFSETFAPVACLDTIRFFIALIAVYDLELHHVDIKTAFLNGNLDETIYMHQPPGFINPACPDKVWRLKKSIYGLKQALCQWNKALKDALMSFRFKSLLTGDVCIFIYRQQGGNNFTISVIYVDDLFIFGTSIDHICETKANLASCFSISDLGEATQFLGLHITRD